MIIIGVADGAYTLMKDGDPIREGGNIHDVLLGVDFNTIDAIACAEKPYLRLERIIETYIASTPKNFAAFRQSFPAALKHALFYKRGIIENVGAIYAGMPKRDIGKKLLYCDSQTALCAAAFFPSPCEQAIILCLDQAVEWSGTSLACGNGNDITIESEILFPHSLEFFIGAFANYLGIDRAQIGEIAASGDATYARMIARSVIDIKPDGSFLLNQFYFDYADGGEWMTPPLHDLLGGGPRPEGESISQRHHNIAASVMAIVAQIVSAMVHHSARSFKNIHNLCVTGSIAAESIVRERILRDHSFDHVYICPDEGHQALARGAALAAHYMHYQTPRDIMFLQTLPTTMQK